MGKWNANMKCMNAEKTRSAVISGIFALDFASIRWLDAAPVYAPHSAIRQFGFIRESFRRVSAGRASFSIKY